MRRPFKNLWRHIRHPRDWYRFYRIKLWWNGYDEGHAIGYDEGARAGYNACLKRMNGRPKPYSTLEERGVLPITDVEKAVKEPGGL